MRTLIVALLGLSLTASSVAAVAMDDGVVHLDSGAVRGTVTERHRIFQGVPFAQPPVGDLRWREPRPITPWTGVRPATAPGPHCAQAASLWSTGSTSEDCLYLNVTAPRGERTGRPVLVWVHGGGFMTGAGSDYGARRFVERTGTIVVTVNYRLGALGFFGYPGLKGSGVFGLADQQAALRWVRRNAVAFGGDPTRVTLAGESAGGMSVCAHVTAPGSAGLFQRAIVQSGACSTAFIDHAQEFSVFTPRETVERLGAEAAIGGCTDLACLRALPVETLLAPEINERFLSPAHDSTVLPIDPVVAVRDGRVNRVPVLIGTTRDEHTLFTALGNARPIEPRDYPAAVAEVFGPTRADRIVAEYPLDDDNDARPELAGALTDRVWACPTAETQRQLSRRVRVFGYEFADRGAPVLPGLPPFAYQAYHGSELFYLFDLPSAVQLDEAQQRLSDRMISMWGEFAGSGRVRDASYPQVLSLAPDAVGHTDYPTVHRCEFWWSPEDESRAS